MTDHDRFLTDLQKRAERAHRVTPGAAVPPANLWKHILAQVEVNTHEEETMNTPAFATPTTISRGTFAPQAEKKRGFAHYLHLAVTIALVAAVAVAGWFAAMQLNPPGEPEPRLAIMTATPGINATPRTVSATCDVEPISTDTVMGIVKNPARFMAQGATGEPLDTPMVGSPTNAELWEVDPDLELIGASSTPTEEQFNDASVVANQYLNCLLHGTQGQIWTFYSPVLLQQKIMGEFPVFAQESQVRERVEELSELPAYEAEYPWVEVLSVNTNAQPGAPPDWEFDTRIGSLEVNPDYQLTRSHQSESFYYEYVLSIGISIEDVDGKQTILTNGTGGDVLPRQPGQNPTMIHIQVAKLRSSDGWVVIPWPSQTELGWDQY